MSFEFEHAWAAMRDGGALVADDVNVNPAWDEFTQRVRRRPQPLGSKLSLIVK
jgi:hypothetical protein